MTSSPGRAFLDRRLELLAAGKFKEMVDADYNDDALLVDFNGTVRGRVALTEHFERHLSAMGSIYLKSVDKFVETPDTVFVEITVITGAYGEVTSHEGFVLRDGKADYHFTALK